MNHTTTMNNISNSKNNSEVSNDDNTDTYYTKTITKATTKTEKQ